MALTTATPVELVRQFQADVADQVVERCASLVAAPTTRVFPSASAAASRYRVV